MADSEHYDEKNLIRLPTTLPVLTVRDMVVFPAMIIPLYVGRPQSLAAIKQSEEHEDLLLLLAQKDLTDEEPDPDSLYTFGTVANIIRTDEMGDERIKILVQGLVKAEVNELFQRDGALNAHFRIVNEKPAKADDVEVEALVRTVKQDMESLVQISRLHSPELLVALSNITDPGRLADLIAANLGLEVEKSQTVLEIIEPMSRLEKVRELLLHEIELIGVQKTIQEEARGSIGKGQREYFLREQLRAIQAELGQGSAQEADELEQKLQEAGLPEEAMKEALKELDRLRRMPGESSEASVVRTYIDWMIELPWQLGERGQLDIKVAEDVLEADHHGLEDVKRRILEFLAVKRLNPEGRSPILCLTGPPGVGKTSLGRSIARALGREFVRISLGGVRDEAEIRGHRRTYVGAMPGRIVQAIKQSGQVDPVFMLDEVDKLGSDFRGDPSSALLEVLDPEQNFDFRDHYLGVPYDLSKVFFIATANVRDAIPGPLLDRFETIAIAGYTIEEKTQIAFRYLIPQVLEAVGLNETPVVFEKAAIERMVTEYTREAGVRQLRRTIESVMRSIALDVARGKKQRKRVTAASLEKFLGPAPTRHGNELEKDHVGVVQGLAWTPTGGEILLVEVATISGNGNMRLTGHLGEVMKESAHAALTWLRAHAADMGIPKSFFEKNDFHVHVPEGAIPKDGPSAGCAMTCALASAATGRPVRSDLAMTGEISLRGRVLPIGGLKEKLLAAVRAGVKEVLIPEDNLPVLKKIPRNVLKGVTITPVSRLEDVVERTLRKPDKSGAKGKPYELKK